MGCKLRPELAAETQQTAWSKMWAKVKSISFNQGNSTDCYIILGHRDKAAPPTSQQVGQVAPKRVKYRHRHPFFFFFLPHPQESSLCSQPIRGNVRRTGRIFPEHIERSFLEHEHSLLAVRRISRTRFEKQKFVQLRTNYVRRTFFQVRRIPRTMFAKQKFAQLRINYVRRTFFRFDEYLELCSRSKRSPN